MEKELEVTLPVKVLRQLAARDNALSLWINQPWTDVHQYRRSVRVSVVRDFPEISFRFERLENESFIEAVELTQAEVFDLVPRLGRVLAALERPGPVNCECASCGNRHNDGTFYPGKAVGQ